MATKIVNSKKTFSQDELQQHRQRLANTLVVRGIETVSTPKNQSSFEQINSDGTILRSNNVAILDPNIETQFHPLGTRFDSTVEPVDSIAAYDKYWVVITHSAVGQMKIYTNDQGLVEEFELAIQRKEKGEPVMVENNTHVNSAPEQNQPTPEHEPEIEHESVVPHTVSRSELLEILSQDGTLAEMEAHVQAKEWTEEEKQLVIDFLSAKDQTSAAELYEKIKDNIMERPNFDRSKDAASNWGQLRVQVADEIKHLSDLERECNGKIAELEEELTIVERKLEAYSKTQNQLPESQNAKSEVQKRIEEMRSIILEELKAERDELSIITKRVSALTLMHSHAQHEESQAKSKIFVENVQDTIKTIADDWRDLKEKVDKSIEPVKTFGRTWYSVSVAVDLTHAQGLSNACNALHVRFARMALKRKNAHEEKIKRIEDRIIARASRISDKEFRKNQFINRLDAVAKGEKLEPMPEEKKMTIEQAREIIANSKTSSFSITEILTKCDQFALDHSKKMRDRKDASIDKHMTKVEKVLKERKENVQQYAEKTANQLRQGKINYGELEMGMINRGIEDALNAASLDFTFTDDLGMWMKEHGHTEYLKDYDPNEQVININDIAPEPTPDVDRDTEPNQQNNDPSNNGKGIEEPEEVDWEMSGHDDGPILE